uniref:NADP-dependent oxidoreductase domain-containing protein n=1 Tax=Plectus sambesii TaxID=2011161 RepID=A0A914URG7_9BILA
MPLIGLGTYQIRDRSTIFAIVDAALESGYRLFDTAQVYGNEEHIGDALRELLPKYNLTRTDIFITSKLSPANHGANKAKKSVEDSLTKLRTDYIDLFLIHWPGVQKISPTDESNRRLRQESWHVLEELRDGQVLKSIGVSNYTIEHLNELLTTAKTTPTVNQCEFHPHYPDFPLVNFCRQHNIHFQAYSSFGSPAFKQNLFHEAIVTEMCAKYDFTAAQILLAWALNQGISVLPRTSNPLHVKENFKATNVTLSPEDIDLLSNVRSDLTKVKYCWNPQRIL